MVIDVHSGSNGHRPRDGRPLRVAMVAPPWYELPPTGYGGIELSCATLIDALAARGHSVTLFGAGRRTGTAATFVSTMPQQQCARMGDELVTALHTARVNRLLATGAYDVVHDHTVSGPLTARQRTAPTVVTAHGPTDGEMGDFYAVVAPHVSLVAISHSQRMQRPELAWAATVHHGIVPVDGARTDRAGGPVLWLARFSPDKGPDIAIDVCRAAGLPLVLAGKCEEPAELRYLDEVIRPKLGADVHLICNADRATSDRLLAAASCLIMPIRWNEPFGMVMIEAMAVGTPVVAMRRGSVPEVVVDGVTGWICDTPAELTAALRRVPDLDRAASVRHVRSVFSAELMARNYEAVYRQVIARSSLAAVPAAGVSVRRR